jgi:hypothetical protein
MGPGGFQNFVEQKTRVLERLIQQRESQHREGRRCAVM